MIVTLSPQTETLLQKQAGLRGQEATELADALLLDALEAAELDYEARVWLETRRVERVNLLKRTGIL